MSFVALTVHWIDPTTRARVMGTLACHHMEGPQTFEKLAALMCEVFLKVRAGGQNSADSHR